MFKMKLLQAFFLVVLCFLTFSVYAAMYRWVDKEGKTHYSDQPPSDADAKAVNAKPASGSSSSTAVKSYQEKDQEFKKRRIEEQEADKKQKVELANTQAKQKNCSDAKSRLALLQAGGRIAKTNEKGEREFLNDKDRENNLREAEKSVSEWCK